MDRAYLIDNSKKFVKECKEFDNFWNHVSQYQKSKYQFTFKAYFDTFNESGIFTLKHLKKYVKNQNDLKQILFNKTSQLQFNQWDLNIIYNAMVSIGFCKNGIN